MTIDSNPKEGLMGVSDSQHFRKTVAGVCMIVAPVLLVVAFAVSPPLETAAGKLLAATAQHQDRALISTFAAMFALILMVGVTLGLMHMMRERGAGYGNVGGAIGLLGLLGVMASFSVGFMTWQMTKDGVSVADVHLLHQYNQSAGAVVIGVLGFTFALGYVILAMGLYRAHFVDWWMAMLVAIGPVLIEVAFPAHALWMAIVGSSFLLVGLGSIGLMVLRETDEEWEHTPEYRGFRPAAGMS
jgi:hypothetical protein